MKSIYIDNFEIKQGGKVFIIAELSANHNGSLQTALDTIDAAKKAGADAIKLQTYQADTITIDCDNENFQIKGGTLWDGKTLFELYQEAYTPWEWHKELFEKAREVGLICFSSPFDPSAVDFLEELNVPAYKIASFEITDIPLIKFTAAKGKPVIISTGIAELDDIKLAIDACRSEGNDQIILLKCTSSYPAPLELANMNTIPDMRQRFNILIGLSDHTLGSTVPVVAASLGACVIEKHIILDKEIGGPDAAFSMDFLEFKQMVDDVRKAEKSLGLVSYELSPKVKENKRFSRSLYIVKDVKKGEILDEDSLRSIRPGNGLHPKHFSELLGKTVNKDVSRGTPMSWDLVN